MTNLQLSRVARLGDAIENLGWLNSGKYLWRRALNKFTQVQSDYQLSSKFAKAPLWCRPGTSDGLVFDQIFRQREYRCLDHVQGATTIIDCGANVGFSSAYLLSRFPQARLVAVEPDVGNFEILRRNLLVYGDRAIAIRSGVWSHVCDLAISEEKFGDGREWAVTVRPAVAGDVNTMSALSIPALIERLQCQRVSILKMDIEGSERQVFSAVDLSWLDVVDNLVIELHGQDCSSVFFNAIAGRGFQVTTCDELTVCTRV